VSGGIKEYQGVFKVDSVSETAQVELRSGGVEAPASYAMLDISMMFAISFFFSCSSRSIFLYTLSNATRQGLTLVHLSAQLEPRPTHTKHPTHPYTPLNTT